MAGVSVAASVLLPRSHRIRIQPADLCHPVIGRQPFTREGWTFELKHDGFRALVRKDGTEAALSTRWGRSLVHAFPEVTEAVHGLPDGVYDGELVVPDAGGRSDFAALRRRFLLQRPRLIELAATKTPAVLVLFDVLALNGSDLRGLHLAKRKELLAAHVQSRRHLQVIESIWTFGEALFAVICTHDCEGIVGKRLDAPYRAGRQPSWVKTKNRQYSRQEAIVWSGDR